MPSLLHDARAEQQLLVSVTTYHSLLEKWGVEHLYDTTPYPFMPSPTCAPSSPRPVTEAWGFCNGVRGRERNNLFYAPHVRSGVKTSGSQCAHIRSAAHLWMILSLVVLAFPTMLGMVVNERLQSHVQHRRN